MTFRRHLKATFFAACCTHCCLDQQAYGDPIIEIIAPAAILSDFTGFEFERAIVAGAATGGVPGNDSPAQRVDPNTNVQPFGGVVSLNVNGGLCSGTLLAADIILTAGHCVDPSGGAGFGDGVPDMTPGQITVNFNSGSTLSATRGVSSIHLNPDFDGFANPRINDDLAILRLSSDAPAGVPIYDLLPAGTLSTSFVHPLFLVGYGNTGTGTSGYTASASFTTKRFGGNVVEAFGTDGTDEGDGSKVEIFFHDFESTASGPLGTIDGISVYEASGGNSLGAVPYSLGNLVEANIGGGDSGGPAFFWDSVSGTYLLAGVNTATSNTGLGTNGRFGTIGAGMWLESYLPWVESFLPQATEVPEPSTYAAATGLTLVGLWTWRRRRASRRDA